MHSVKSKTAEMYSGDNLQHYHNRGKCKQHIYIEQSCRTCVFQQRATKLGLIPASLLFFGLGRQVLFYSSVFLKLLILCERFILVPLCSFYGFSVRFCGNDYYYSAKKCTASQFKQIYEEQSTFS